MIFSKINKIYKKILRQRPEQKASSQISTETKVASVRPEEKGELVSEKQIAEPEPCVLYPFVPRTRNGIVPSQPDEITAAWMNAIQDVQIKNARRGKLYMITGAYGPSHPKFPCRWVVDEADIQNFETTTNTTRLISYTHKQRHYTVGTGRRKISLSPVHPDHAEIQIQITLNTDVATKGILRAGAETDTGFAYVIDPSKYTLKPARKRKHKVKTVQRTKPLQIKGRGKNIVSITFSRDAKHDFRFVMRPNGSNGLFNFRSAYVIDKAAQRSKRLVNTSSDLVPPLKIRSLEENVDDIPQYMPQVGYTGGNHTSDGGMGGTPTARLVSIRHFVDGSLIDARKGFDVGGREYKVRWVNELMAWNTKECGRYVAKQIVTAVVRPGTIEFWHEVVALENILVIGDNGIQTFSNGFSSVLFYNGVNRTNREDIWQPKKVTSGTCLTVGYDCFAASLKGDAMSGTQTVWIDRTYGIGDGQYMGGRASWFRISASKDKRMPKIYPTLISGSRAPAFGIGQGYKWHMGIVWGGLEGFDVDSAAIIHLRKKPHLLFAKTDDLPGTIKLQGPVMINGQELLDAVYRTVEPAGAYLYSIEPIAKSPAPPAPQEISVDASAQAE